ncbi:MAG: PAS domain S-box protein [Anaerolineae bacterium]|nr:PAS domain S-box protein [Anaerolineae bacterium]
MDDWVIYLYFGASLLAATVTTGITVYAWQQRQVASADTFARLLVCASLMLWGGLFRNIVPLTSPFISYMHSLTMLGIIVVPPAWLIFTLDYSGNAGWLTRRRVVGLFVIPALSVLLLLTNSLHGWFFRDVTFYRIGFLNGFTWVYGFWFYVHSAYSYTLTALGVVLLVRFALRTFRLYRLQAVLLILGAAGVLIPNLLLTFRITRLSYVFLGFMVMAVLYAQAIFRYRLLNLVPVARHALVDTLSDGMLVVDGQGKIVDLNPAMAQFLGVSIETPIGQPVWGFLPSGAAWETWLETTTGVQATFTRDGTHDSRIYDVQVTLLRDRWKRISGRLLVLHDITERQQAAEALQRYTQELEARNAELDAFAHTVAHDLKNPLTAIVGYGSLLTSNYESVSESQRLDMLHTINRQSWRMTRIIEEILLLASLRKLDDMIFSPLDMGQIVAEVQERLALAIEEKQAILIVPETWPAAIGYAAWVEEIWANYLSNALKYGGEPPRVELGFTRPDFGVPALDAEIATMCSRVAHPETQIVFWVRDNGAGLSAEEQGRLFMPFTRLDQISAKGHGLGLSIVRRISDKLGGQVGVVSTPGAGSVFWFTLPAVAQPEASVP